MRGWRHSAGDQSNSAPTGRQPFVRETYERVPFELNTPDTDETRARDARDALGIHLPADLRTLPAQPDPVLAGPDATLDTVAAAAGHSGSFVPVSPRGHAGELPSQARSQGSPIHRRPRRAAASRAPPLFRTTSALRRSGLVSSPPLPSAARTAGVGRVGGARRVGPGAGCDRQTQTDTRTRRQSRQTTDKTVPEAILVQGTQHNLNGAAGLATGADGVM